MNARTALIVGAVLCGFVLPTVGFALALCRAAAPPWWERTQDDIDSLPETPEPPDEAVSPPA